MSAPRPSVPRLVPLALALALAACDDERAPSAPPPGAVAAALRVAAGDGQIGLVGAALPSELVVEVVDTAGRPMPGVPVRFAVVAGGGTVAEEAGTSNGWGQVRTRWTLGTAAADSQVVEARADQLAPVRLRAAVRHGAAASLALAAGNGGAGPVGSALADSLAVTAKDRFGNPVEGVEVAWEAVAGGGALSPARGSTGADGVARTRWTLGTRVDSAQVAVARVAGLDSIAFTASAVTAGAPLLLSKRGGDGQRGTAGGVLADSLGVLLRMPDGRPVAGAVVSWSVPPASGVVSPVATRTDANGAASAAWRLGTSPGLAQATATVDSGALVFTSLVQADAPATVVALAGGGEGPVGGALADSLAVRVTDRHGNPVPGAEVDWSAQTGGGAVQPARSTTDAQGVARAQWTLGPLAGTPGQAAAATLAGLPPVAFQATAVTRGTPLQLARRGGDGQRGPAGSLLADSLGVALRLPDGRGVSGVPVRWSVPPGAGTVAPAESRTDENGAASAAWRLGTGSGLAQATAVVDEGTLTFTALVEADAPAEIVAVAGGGEGPVGGTLADSLAVRVTDRHGNPAAGAEVDWAAGTGGGSVQPARSTADAQGIARARWTLGLLAGPPGQTATATLPGLPAVGFRATAFTRGVPLQLARVGGDAQTGEVGLRLADSLVAQLRTPAGAPVEGATVAWAVTGGGGQVLPATSRTDAQGRARAGWTMGTVPGAARASATVDQGALAFAATSVAGAPAAVRSVAGDGQTAVRGTALADSLVARVVDRYGNAVPNAWVRWRLTAGDGHLQPDSSRTGASGEARARWAVGFAAGAPNLVSATAGAAPPAQFSATAAVGELVLARMSPTRVPYTFLPLENFYINSTVLFSVRTAAGAPVVGAVIRGGHWGTFQTDWAGEARFLWATRWRPADPYDTPSGNPVLILDFEDQFIWFASTLPALVYWGSGVLLDPGAPVFQGDTVRVRVDALEMNRRHVPGMEVQLEDDQGWSSSALAGSVVQWPVGSALGRRSMTVCGADVHPDACGYVFIEVLARP